MSTGLRNTSDSRIDGRRFSRRRALGFSGGLAGAHAFARADGVGARPTPSSVGRLLSYMATRPDFKTYLWALPIMGVDGTEAIFERV